MLVNFLRLVPRFLYPVNTLFFLSFLTQATIIYCIIMGHTKNVRGKGKILHRHMGSHEHTPDPRSPYIHANSIEWFYSCYPLLHPLERVDQLHGCDLSGRQLTRVGEPALGQRTGLITICMVVSCQAGI